MFFLILASVMLHADKKWIPINTINETKVSSSNLQSDMHLSQMEPINKVIKNLTVAKQLLDNANKVKPTVHEKKWFLLTEDAK